MKTPLIPSKYSASLLLMVFIFLGGCSTLTRSLLIDPQISAENLSVKSVSLDKFTLNLDLKIANPNPIALDLDKVDYHLKLNDEVVTEGSFEKGVSIPAQGEGVVVIPMNFRYGSVGNALQTLFKASASKKYSLAGEVQFGFFSIPFKKEGDLKLGL